MSLRDERGMTLIEMLVTVSLGMIVLLALMDIADVSLRASARVEDRVEVSQRGRIAMDQIAQQIRSQVCLGPGSPAVTEGLDTSVTFYSQLGDENSVPQRRRLFYDNGTITEETYVGNGTPPNMNFSNNPTRVRDVISSVSPVGATPVFQYYAFTNTDPPTPTELLPTPLSDADMARTVKIGVSFVVSPLKARNSEVESVFQDDVYSRKSDPTQPQQSPKCD
jgi:Tfp pilus assembly protein PilW